MGGSALAVLSGNRLLLSQCQPTRPFLGDKFKGQIGIMRLGQILLSGFSNNETDGVCCLIVSISQLARTQWGKQQLGSGSPVYPTFTAVKFSTDYLAIVHKMPTMSHLSIRETKIKKAALTLVTLGGQTYRPIFKYTLLNISQ